jgi:hypothetical protein
MADSRLKTLEAGHARRKLPWSCGRVSNIKKDSVGVFANLLGVFVVSRSGPKVSLQDLHGAAPSPAVKERAPLNNLLFGSRTHVRRAYAAQPLINRLL